MSFGLPTWMLVALVGLVIVAAIGVIVRFVSKD